SCGTWTHYWYVALSGTDGTLVISMCDTTNLLNLQSVHSITDGILHHVLIARTSGVLSITIDGHLDNSVADAVDLVSLGMLQVGVSVCGSPLVGKVTNVCLSTPGADQ